MTCMKHLAPERQCSFCGHGYCDKENHGHTPQHCLSVLENGMGVAIGNLVHFANNLKEAKRRYEEKEATL